MIDEGYLLFSTYKVIKNMKNITMIGVISFSFFACIGQENIGEVVSKPNVDSIKCVEAWQEFILQEDTLLLTLKYKEPYTIQGSKDKLTITLLDILDGCSEESAKITYGCKVEVSLKLQLNNDCEYVTKYPITIGRYSLQHWKFNSIKNLYCNFLNSKASVVNEELQPHLLFHNTMITLWKVAPFGKTNAELFEILKTKETYIVSIYLQKRCF
jgi:hypothetical protein